MKNPFVIFGIPPVFDIDLTELARYYRTLASSHHPDRGGDAITMEDINVAYNTLKNPIKRARALIELHGITIADDEILTDPTILEEIFELRMQDDKKVAQQKQQEALQNFKNAITSNQTTTIQHAYWRLLYLHTL